MTSEDEKLLHDLGRLVRAQERTPDQELLEQLSRSELPQSQRAALQARASGDVELEHALNAYAPLSSDVRAQIVARARVAALETTSQQPAASVADAEDEDEDEDALAEPLALADQRGRAARNAATTRARSWRAPVLWLATPLAAAAAALLWFNAQDHRGTALPEYQLQVLGGEADVRGTPIPLDAAALARTPVRMGPETRLRVALRPATATGSDVTAVAYLVRSADVQAWPAEITKAESGAMQLMLSPAPAAIDARASVLIVVGRPELLATHKDQLVHEQSARGDGFQRFVVPLTGRSE